MTGGSRLTSARSSRGNERGGPQVLGLAYATIQVLGLLAAGKAVMEARTAQGATAWALALVAFPLFLVFGQSRFRDYVTARLARLSAPIQ
jgi:cardiolipin synthase